MTDDQDQEIRIPIVYVGAEDIPIHYGNHFVIQHQQNEFILTIGQLSPPIMLGSDQEQREQASQISYVPVKVIARVAFTRARIAELIQVLTINLARYDKKMEEEGNK